MSHGNYVFAEAFFFVYNPHRSFNLLFLCGRRLRWLRQLCYSEVAMIYISDELYSQRQPAVVAAATQKAAAVCFFFFFRGRQKSA